MTDEIIIDGVDISKCSEYCGTRESINGEIYYKCFRNDCTDKPNCYYKQLERKKQECEQLAEKLDIAMRNNMDKTLLKLENDDLKRQLDIETKALNDISDYIAKGCPKEEPKSKEELFNSCFAFGRCCNQCVQYCVQTARQVLKEMRQK